MMIILSGFAHILRLVSLAQDERVRNLKRKLALISITFISNIYATETDLSFAKEFIQTYDLSKRDTHEYNPYILKKTGNSFLQLEKNLKDEGFTLSGRLCIFGYQEEAVFPYTTDWQRAAIEDETIVKTHAGISGPTKNIFGFMTGFLLKDAQWMQNQWFKQEMPNILHIFARPIDIFKDSALIFQKHAFGKEYDYLISTRDKIEYHLYNKDLKKILTELVDFWSNLESRIIKTGADERVATQDMLFSIDYARALVEANSEIKKFFLGPDITYPIEVLSCQKTHATLHAQDFVQKVQEDLISVGNENTAYIFCSYVDGVGKSTLLNNIKNWKKHGKNFESYERCDNSSSQDAQIFQLKDKVFIVDLPAQMSHFVIKPDGFVFCDINTIKEIDRKKAHEIHKYIIENKEKLLQEFQATKNKLLTDNVPLYANNDFYVQYAHNCNILKVEEKWIGAKYQNYCLIFDKDNPEKLRILVPLAQAHSTGLKNLEPEQMLFSKGLSLPMKYQSFIDDLVKKLKNANIKNILFVDFLSMYPRSSREIIRLNFVLQYIQKIFKENYDINYSFYKHRVNKEQELCYFLNKNFDKATKSLVLESILRWSLDVILEKIPTSTIANFSGVELESELKQICNRLMDNESILSNIASSRLNIDKKQFNDIYALDRIYQTIVSFDPKVILEFSNFVQNLFANKIDNQEIKNIWSDLVEKIDLKNKNNDGNGKYEIIQKIHNDCRQEKILKDFIRPVRAQWYALFSNLLNSIANSDTNFQIDKLNCFVPPLILNKEIDNHIYAITKSLPVIDLENAEIKLPSLSEFNIAADTLENRNWSLFNKNVYCLDWTVPESFSGIFGYGYVNSDKKNFITRIIDIYHHIFLKSGKPTWSVSTNILYSQLVYDQIAVLLKKDFEHIKYKTTLNSNDPKLEGIRLWVRIIATLDMILPDPEAKVLIRRGNKEDFISAIKLLEKITLPLCFSIKLNCNLFDDYNLVEPVVSWDTIGLDE